MLKLFTAHNSICTQKVFLTLIEKGLPWTSEYIDLFNNEQYRPESRAATLHLCFNDFRLVVMPTSGQ